jgi:alkylation response protein AidB-like acyl-CoA dehydrogenase
VSDYRAPIADIRFALTHSVGISQLSALPSFAHADDDLISGILQEAGRFAEDVLAPLNRTGDEEGAHLNGGVVSCPAGFPQAYQQFIDAGWGTLGHPSSSGGGGLPLTLTLAVRELIISANIAFSMAPFLGSGVVSALLEHGSADQIARYIPHLVTGEWTGTMDITEPQAGSDVGATSTRAIPDGDGTYLIKGQKTFISFGDHDLTEQIIHLVLARLPDAPPGTKGLSLFIVPKRLMNPDGTMGERNDLKVIGIEHKLGLRASPTCTVVYGDDALGAHAELIGEPHDGIRQMFTMMNDARLGVGLQGLALAERAYQQATHFAAERVQGRAFNGPPGSLTPIVEHPDVRRMLLTMKSQITAMRFLIYANAKSIDLAKHHPDPAVRESEGALADLLTPISKAWCTDLGVELTSTAIQIHGGMGFVEETGVAQFYRDVRITPIYEGTNGIQAIDLAMRKLPMNEGKTVAALIQRARDAADRLAVGDTAGLVLGLTSAIDSLERSTLWMSKPGRPPQDRLAGATPFLRLMATVLGAMYLSEAALSATASSSPAAANAVELTRFYVLHVLPLVHALEPSVVAGAASLYGLSAAEL